MTILFVIFILLFSSVLHAQTPTPTPGGVCNGIVVTLDVASNSFDDSGNGGTHTWVNTANAANGCQAASAGGDSSSAGLTHYLGVNDYGFSIPGGFVIQGIGVKIEKNKNGGLASDSEVRLIKADGSYSSANKASGSQWPSSFPMESYYGGSTDTWGESWTEADINDSDFGVVISANYSGAAFAPNVDCIEISVCYSAPTPTPTPTPPCDDDNDCKLGCCGDCNEDGEVTAEEVNTCVQIEAGLLDLSECEQCDCNNNGTLSQTELNDIMVNASDCCEQNGACVGNICVTVTPTATFTPIPVPTANGGIDLFESTTAPTPTDTGTPTTTPTPTVTPTFTPTVPPEELPVEAELEAIGTGDADLEVEPRDPSR